MLSLCLRIKIKCAFLFQRKWKWLDHTSASFIFASSVYCTALRLLHTSSSCIFASSVYCLKAGSYFCASVASCVLRLQAHLLLLLYISKFNTYVQHCSCWIILLRLATCFWNTVAQVEKCSTRARMLHVSVKFSTCNATSVYKAIDRRRKMQDVEVWNRLYPAQKSEHN